MDIYFIDLVFDLHGAVVPENRTQRYLVCLCKHQQNMCYPFAIAAISTIHSSVFGVSFLAYLQAR